MKGLLTEECTHGTKETRNVETSFSRVKHYHSFWASRGEEFSGDRRLKAGQRVNQDGAGVKIVASGRNAQSLSLFILLNLQLLLQKPKDKEPGQCPLGLKI